MIRIIIAINMRVKIYIYAYCVCVLEYTRYLELSYRVNYL